jgi:hypothetical protein
MKTARSPTAALRVLGRVATLLTLAVAIPAGAERPRGAHRLPTRAERHPLHTSLTRIETDDRGNIAVRVRAFSDDFAAAVARATGSVVGPDYTVNAGAAERYIASGFQLRVGGQVVPLRLLSQKRDGDVTWLELRGSCTGSLSGAMLESRLLMEFHEDQVNIVQAHHGGKSHTMLFSRGVPARRLP